MYVTTFKGEVGVLAADFDTSKGDAEVSWTQTDPAMSLTLIQEICPSGRVIDIGGGTSALAGRLLGSGYSVAVVDISENAIRRARKQLGAT